MLNDAGGYGQGEEDEREAPDDADQIFQKLQKWCKRDFNSKGQTAWRTAAREDFDFEAGEQLTEDDKAILQDAKRPIVIFNRVGPVVDSVSGQEVGNRQEVQFLPRSEGDVQVNELLNDIDHSRSVASLTKEQAAAVTRTLSKGAMIALVIGIAGLVATIGFGIRGAALALG